MAEVEPRVAWIESFIKAQGEFPPIGKGSRVDTGSFAYNYASLPDILDKVSDVLRNYGLVLVQSVAGSPDTVTVETRIYHKAGHVETFGPLHIASSRDPKAVGSAVTYARRYALCAALGIAPDEDDDGERASRVREPEAVSPWVNLWNELKILKAWTDDQRRDAIQVAVDSLAIKSGSGMTKEEADRVFSHVTGQYEHRDEQGALPVE